MCWEDHMPLIYMPSQNGKIYVIVIDAIHNLYKFIKCKITTKNK